jgi:hypothetical protein
LRAKSNSYKSENMVIIIHASEGQSTCGAKQTFENLSALSTMRKECSAR